MTMTMTGAYGAELEEKFFIDAEKTSFKDALKYVTMLVWNGESIQASPYIVVLVLNLVFVSFFLFHSCSFYVILLFLFPLLFFFFSSIFSSFPFQYFFLLFFCFMFHVFVPILVFVLTFVYIFFLL